MTRKRQYREERGGGEYMKLVVPLLKPLLELHGLNDLVSARALARVLASS